MIHPIPREFYSDIETNDWLFELISSGHIMSGAVSRASISDLTASDLSGYTRVHLLGIIYMSPKRNSAAGRRSE